MVDNPIWNKYAEICKNWQNLAIPAEAPFFSRATFPHFDPVMLKKSGRRFSSSLKAQLLSFFSSTSDLTF
jgi:hypothetical protein